MASVDISNSVILDSMKNQEIHKGVALILPTGRAGSIMGPVRQLLL